MNSIWHEISASGTESGQRLDKWLAAHLPEISRSRLQSLIKEGKLQRNGSVVTDPSANVQPGDYRLEIPPALPMQLQPVDMPLDILFEDEHLLVINKPPGLTVHPAPGQWENTLVHALLAHCGDSLSGIGGVQRPGIVHRLDKDTSGAMLVAKNDAAHQALAAQLKDRTLSRQYLAVCHGLPKPPAGIIKTMIGRSPKNRKKMAVLKEGGKEAVTHYQTVEALGNGSYSLICCKLQTGRTHQIRVHLSHLGHPLVGDPVYGRRKSDSEYSLVSSFSRQALHAAAIAFVHPTTGERLSFEAPCPTDFITLKESLRP